MKMVLNSAMALIVMAFATLSTYALIQTAANQLNRSVVVSANR
jgi:hypothetical protein